MTHRGRESNSNYVSGVWQRDESLADNTDFVKEGDVLVTLDPTVLARRLKKPKLHWLPAFAKPPADD